jgi:hypothetical protein
VATHFLCENCHVATVRRLILGVFVRDRSRRTGLTCQFQKDGVGDRPVGC